MRHDDMRTLVLHAYEDAVTRAEDARTKSYPDVVARAEGQASAFLAVLDLMDGHTAMISRFTGGTKL